MTQPPDPGLPDLPDDWNTGDTFDAEDLNDIAERINAVENDNADDLGVMTGTVTTASATAAKTVTLDDPWAGRAPVNGDYYRLKFTAGMAVSSPTVAINGNPAIPIRTTQGQTSSSYISAEAGASLLFHYDGTYLRPVGSPVTSVTSGASAAEIDAGSSSTVRGLSPQIIAQKLARLTTVPASATATGSPGQFSYDATYLYVCVAANTWRRVAIAGW